MFFAFWKPARSTDVGCVRARSIETRSIRWPVALSTRSAGSPAVRTTPLVTGKLVALVARRKITLFCCGETRTLWTGTPTNCRDGTKTYRVCATTTGPPTYPPNANANDGGTGAHPMKSSVYAQVTHAGAHTVPGTQTQP